MNCMLGECEICVDREALLGEYRIWFGEELKTACCGIENSVPLNWIGAENYGETLENL